MSPRFDCARYAAARMLSATVQATAARSTVRPTVLQIASRKTG